MIQTRSEREEADDTAACLLRAYTASAPALLAAVGQAARRTPWLVAAVCALPACLWQGASRVGSNKQRLGQGCLTSAFGEHHACCDGCIPRLTTHTPTQTHTITHKQTDQRASHRIDQSSGRRRHDAAAGREVKSDTHIHACTALHFHHSPIRDSTATKDHHLTIHTRPTPRSHTAT